MYFIMPQSVTTFTEILSHLARDMQLMDSHVSRGGRRWPALATSANPEAFRVTLSLETLSAFMGTIFRDFVISSVRLLL